MKQFSTTTVPQVENISKADFIMQYYKAQNPALIAGHTTSWTAYKKWSLVYIQQSVGNQILLLYNNMPVKGSENKYAPKKELVLGIFRVEQHLKKPELSC